MYGVFKMKTNKKPTQGKNLDEFIKHLEIGLDAAGLNLEEYNPMYVLDKKTNERGFLFSQVMDDAESSVVAFNDRVEFPSGTSIIINKTQPASQVAILFIVSIIQNNPIEAPLCPECEKEEVLA